MLRLEAESVSASVPATGLTDNAPVQTVGCVELEARLGRVYIQNPTAGRLFHVRGVHEFCVSQLQHEVVIVAAADPQLRIILIDPRSNGCGLREVEGRACHRCEGPCGKVDRSGSALIVSRWPSTFAVPAPARLK